MTLAVPMTRLWIKPKEYPVQRFTYQIEGGRVGKNPRLDAKWGKLYTTLGIGDELPPDFPAFRGEIGLKDAINVYHRPALTQPLALVDGRLELIDEELIGIGYLFFDRPMLRELMNMERVRQRHRKMIFEYVQRELDLYNAYLADRNFSYTIFEWGYPLRQIKGFDSFQQCRHAALLDIGHLESRSM